MQLTGINIHYVVTLFNYRASHWNVILLTIISGVCVHLEINEFAAAQRD